MKFERLTRAAAVGACLAGLPALGGCMITPGTFAATMELRRDGSFGFSYDGEIYMLALGNLAEMARKADAMEAEFVPEDCWDEDTYEDRDCTAEELSEQRAEWDAGKAKRIANAEQEAVMMRTFLGGIDPSDPEAANELATKLERQAGWDKVTYLGDGVFDVEFAVKSRLDHDFAFPIIEGFPMPTMFVVANRRDGGVVRIDAPGFAPQAGSNPFQGMMASMAGMPGSDATDDGGSDMPNIPQLDGTFRIVTDGTIMANNTDEGPKDSPEGSILEWKVNARTKAAPTALIRIEN